MHVPKIIVIRLALSILFLIMFSGCGTAPVTTKTERTPLAFERVNNIYVVYQNIELFNSKTGLPFTYNGSGFFDFGAHVIRESQAVFAKVSVNVLGGH